MHVYVCVCVREREREGKRETKNVSFEFAILSECVPLGINDAVIVGGGGDGIFVMEAASHTW